MTEDIKLGVSRRTLAKGAAWSVPAAAVVAAAPAYAKSPVPPPPPPVFNWAAGCATVGNGKGGCNGVDKTPQVPVFIQNFSGQTLQFQILGARFWKDGDPEPTTALTTPQIWTNTGYQDRCSPRLTTTGCGGYLTVTLESGTCANLWIVREAALGSSDAFRARFRYRWVTPPIPGPPAAGCEVVGSAYYEATPTVIIPSNNCDSSEVSREACSSNKRLATPETPVAEEKAEAKPAAEQTTNPTTEVKVDAAPSAEEAPAAKKAAPAKEAPTAEPTPAVTPAAAEPTEAVATEG